MRLPVDPDLGSTFYTLGLIEGGVAPNVIPAHASAEVMFRTIGSADDILAVLAALKPRVQISEVLRVRPIRMHTVSGFETHVFPFTTDVPLLDRWGTPLLFGPGLFSWRTPMENSSRSMNCPALLMASSALRVVA